MPDYRAMTHEQQNAVIQELAEGVEYVAAFQGGPTDDDNNARVVFKTAEAMNNVLTNANGNKGLLSVLRRESNERQIMKISTRPMPGVVTLQPTQTVPSHTAVIEPRPLVDKDGYQQVQGRSGKRQRRTTATGETQPQTALPPSQQAVAAVLQKPSPSTEQTPSTAPPATLESHFQQPSTK
jgi:hypothetical protein